MYQPRNHIFMNTPKLTRTTKLLIFAGVLFVGIVASIFLGEQSDDEKNDFAMVESSYREMSVEYAIYEESPAGSAGGRIIPASCPSNLHDSWTWAGGLYDNLCQKSNDCGDRSLGRIQCDGNCSAPKLAEPPWYGNACTRSNSCGDTNPGTRDCNNSCDASKPAEPPGYGNACSSSNSCGVTNSGNINCDGNCSASKPAEPPGYGNSCNPSNSCGMTNSTPGNIKCSGCDKQAPSDLLCISASITASPGSLYYKAYSFIKWKSENADSCSVAPENWSGIWGHMSTGNFTEASKTYTVTCNGTYGGSDTDFTIVTMKAPYLSKFISDLSPADSGELIDLSWKVRGAKTCFRSGGSGSQNYDYEGNIRFGKNTVTQLATTKYTLTCDSPGGTDIKSVYVYSPTGSISAGSCEIESEAESCDSSVAWNVNYLKDQLRVTGGISYNSGLRGSPSSDLRRGYSHGQVESVAVNPNSRTFVLEDTGGAFQRTATANVTCKNGSTWNGDVCKTVPEVVITTSPDIVQSGSTVEISGTVESNGYKLECTVRAGNLKENFTYDPAITGSESYNYTSNPLTSAQIIQVYCESQDWGGAVSNEAEIRIEVIPTTQET
jgi:hypothetical protein